ncbi:DeoR/GlpR family DNA-binding transcription regulator [Labrys monachus]|uniref:DeoR family transcriptional regulator of aga operon n=1 Tax=Labrys monachus TaxID=217067 RepID=A0ABU0FF77_9HYPH|nr:DeoR/GlpR family DNA-binding transcription regulator [Labrys monachus]MDQ0393265.1 DeoR family transcriptional regulator of aga operon [Labrys monachus]
MARLPRKSSSEDRGDAVPATRDEEGGRGRVELIPAKRRALILECLKREGAVGVQELIDVIGASPSTIRRDLEYLEQQGALGRTHGGAMLQRTELATFEPDLATAAHFSRAEKEAIGAAMASELRAGQSVIFDASTTVLEVARAIAAAPIRLTAVTNSLAVAQVLAGVPEVRLVVMGGTCKPGSLTLAGHPGENFLRTIYADVAIIGTHAITGGRLTETSLEVAAMKQAMIKAARRVVVLADNSKFTTPNFCTICDLSEIDEIITDDGIDPAQLTSLQSSDVAVRVVKVVRNAASSRS